MVRLIIDNVIPGSSQEGDNAPSIILGVHLDLKPSRSTQSNTRHGRPSTQAGITTPMSPQKKNCLLAGSNRRPRDYITYGATAFYETLSI